MEQNQQQQPLCKNKYSTAPLQICRHSLFESIHFFEFDITPLILDSNLNLNLTTQLAPTDVRITYEIFLASGEHRAGSQQQSSPCVLIAVPIQTVVKSCTHCIRFTITVAQYIVHKCHLFFSETNSTSSENVKLHIHKKTSDYCTPPSSAELRPSTPANCGDTFVGILSDDVPTTDESTNEDDDATYEDDDAEDEDDDAEDEDDDAEDEDAEAEDEEDDEDDDAEDEEDDEDDDAAEATDEEDDAEDEDDDDDDVDEKEEDTKEHDTLNDTDEEVIHVLLLSDSQTGSRSASDDSTDASL
jgi:hypothetical protein